MNQDTNTFFLLVQGHTLRHKALSDHILELDQKNWGGSPLEFSIEKRRDELFEERTQLAIAILDGKLVGYVQFSEDVSDQKGLTISQIQLEKEQEGGELLRCLISYLFSITGKRASVTPGSILESNEDLISKLEKADLRVQDTQA